MCDVSEFKEKSDLINELLTKMDLNFEDDMTREERENLDVERQMFVLRAGWNNMSVAELKELLTPKPAVMEKIICLFCKKEVEVKLISYGDGRIATCPKCGKLAYNGK